MATSTGRPPGGAGRQRLVDVKLLRLAPDRGIRDIRGECPVPRTKRSSDFARVADGGAGPRFAGEKTADIKTRSSSPSTSCGTKWQGRRIGGRVPRRRPNAREWVDRRRYRMDRVLETDARFHGSRCRSWMHRLEQTIGITRHGCSSWCPRRRPKAIEVLQTKHSTQIPGKQGFPAEGRASGVPRTRSRTRAASPLTSMR